MFLSRLPRSLTNFSRFALHRPILTPSLSSASFNYSSAARFSTAANGASQSNEAQPNATQTPNQSQTQQQTAEQKTAPPADAKPLEVQLAEAQKQFTDLQSKSKELQDKYLRTLAEVENVRNRGRVDADNAKKFAMTGFAKDLLEVADTLELAAKSVEESVANSSDPIMKSLFDGIKMTETVLLKTFEKNGIKKFSPLGEKFDPNFHHGLFQVDDPTKDPNTVHSVMKAGYKISERILRAAQVGTVKNRS